MILGVMEKGNGMEYVFRAKGPALGPERSFSALEREKRKKLE